MKTRRLRLVSTPKSPNQTDGETSPEYGDRTKVQNDLAKVYKIITQ